MGQWQPIETAPRDGTPFLLAVVNDLERISCSVAWDGDSWEVFPQWMSHYAISWEPRDGGLLGWMPLPAPPIEEPTP